MDLNNVLLKRYEWDFDQYQKYFIGNLKLDDDTNQFHCLVCGEYCSSISSASSHLQSLFHRTNIEAAPEEVHQIMLGYEKDLNLQIDAMVMVGEPGWRERPLITKV